MANERILLIEDDKDLSNIIETFLKKEGFDVVCSFDGEDGVKRAGEVDPVLILLDIMLPKIDGVEACRQIRIRSHVPVIMISAKNSDMDKMLTLGIGADDYLTKPFSLLEMGARVKSQIRRYTTFHQEKKESPECKVFGNIIINPASFKVMIGEKEIEMTSREFKLLDFLSSHPTQVFSKEQLMDQVWGYSEYIDQNTVTVYIGRVREKLLKGGECYIKTVWGVGYKWEM